MLQAFYKTYYSIAEYIRPQNMDTTLKHSIDLVFNKAVQPAAGLPVGYI